VKPLVRAAAAAASALTAPFAWAQSPQAPPAAPTFSHGGDAMLQVLVYLFLLVAVLAGAVFFMRKGIPFLPQKNSGARKLNISETRGLGNRQFLVVAEYEDRKMLLGVCPGRIDYLCTLAGRDETFSAELREKIE
jgi:flagellar biogenesis protein FliO